VERINGIKPQIRKRLGREVETRRANRPGEKIAQIMTHGQANDQNHFCETIHANHLILNLLASETSKIRNATQL